MLIGIQYLQGFVNFKGIENLYMDFQKKALLALFFCFMLGASAQKETFPLVISESNPWGKDIGLSKPESIVFDRINQCFYISNGQKMALGTDGFISKFNDKGELLKLKWLDSLSRPSGLSIYNNVLWVADVYELKVIDIATGKMVKSFPEPIKSSGLNDVAISIQGEVFVTASFIHAVLKVEEESLILWAQDEKLLQWANGILVNDKDVLVGGTQLTAIHRNTKSLRMLKTNPPIQDIDGLWTDDQGGYFLSTVEGKGLWHLDTYGKSTLLDQGGDYFGDLQFMVETNSLLVPRGNHKEKNYYISAFTLELPR